MTGTTLHTGDGDGDARAEAVDARRQARVDLHCHSRFSSRGDAYLTRSFGLRECATDPRAVHRQAKARGMTHVTLTDHDTIEGALQLADEPGFTVGEEISAYFPTEIVHVHVVAWGIDEARHRDIGELRFNIFELAEYLRGARIPHALAHPFSVVSDLKPEHYEQLLLLFALWETRNGSSTSLENRITAELVDASADLIPRLAEKHGRAPAAERVLPVAGSDDHGGLDIGATYTQVELEPGESDPFAALSRRPAVVCGAEGSTAKTAHTAISLAVRGRLTRPRDGRGGGRRRPLATLAGRLADSEAAQSLSRDERVRRLAGAAAGLTIDPPWRRRGGLRRAAAESAAALVRGGAFAGGGVDHDELAAVVERAWERDVHETLERLRARGFFSRGALADWKALGLTQGVLAPYLLAATSLARQRTHARTVHDALAATGLVAAWPAPAEPHAAVFTDTFAERNGVAAVVQPLVSYAAREDWPLTVVSCDDRRRSEPAHETFAALDRFGFDVYDEFPLFVPPVLQLLHWCEEQGVDLIHAATPGPLGMVAALLARTLNLPFVASYHTDLPRVGFFLTGDHIVRESLWSYVRMFYNQADVVFCPSSEVMDDLAAHGVRTRLEDLDQAIDAARFTPGRRSDEIRRVLGGGGKVMLWVQAPSDDATLQDEIAALAATWQRLRDRRDDVRLIVVGDGLGRDELEARLPGATLLGGRGGDEFATICASVDVFVFPGSGALATRTLLEAAASAVPAVAAAGPAVDEADIGPGACLVVAPGDADDFVAALERLLDDEPLRQAMGLSARERALQHAWPASFARVREVYRTLSVSGRVRGFAP